MKPQYKHDCEKCIFIGNLTINGDAADIYICPSAKGQPITEDHIIIRHSDDPAEYQCTSPWHASFLSPFTAAAIAMWAKYYGFNGAAGLTLFADNPQHNAPRIVKLGQG